MAETPKNPITHMSTQKRCRGRPTLYRAEYAEKAYKVCLLGATDVDLASFFKVSKATINNWKRDHPEFLDSIRRGNSRPDLDERDFRKLSGQFSIISSAATGEFLFNTPFIFTILSSHLLI